MVSKSSHLGFSTLVVFISIFAVISIPSSLASESDLLLKFKSSLTNTTALSSWNASTKPCSSWVGVKCQDGSVRGLQLENMGLAGTNIDVDTLKGLRFLRSISFMNNHFHSQIPNLWKVGALKSVFLSNNRFFGEIPDDAFAKMKSLKFLELSHNEFNGTIPSSLAQLPRLMDLKLDGNKFEGSIPDLLQKSLRTVNMSNNNLKGRIPTRLSKMGSASFSGNKGLCGAPLKKACSNSSSSSTSSSTPTKKASFMTIIIIVIAVLGFVLVLLAILVTVTRRGNQTEQLGRPSSIAGRGKTAGSHDKEAQENSSHSSHSSTSGKKSENMKLSFVRDDVDKFELQDLLRASAEVLGSGSFGSSYKAVLASGKAMVVKRFRHMNNVGREDFQENMRRLGRLRHPNLLPLVAYYYRKEEKLLISDFIENGSLASLLHSNRTKDQHVLDWATRLKIIKGVSSAMAYLHKELPTMSVPHGHLKSSNVVLNESYEPLLTDYGLVPVINNDKSSEIMVTYKSPEFAEQGRVTKKSDVWCLGILMLELLTGKLPMNYLRQGRGTDPDLASWVISVPKEEWTTEIFDPDIRGNDGEGEMMKILNIALRCCETDLEKRLDVADAVEEIEKVREWDS